MKPVNSSQMTKDMLAAMRAAGIRPEIVYAYERTGLLLLEAGYNSLSSQEKAEYDGAIDEYFAQHKKA